jgi:hypothetical protein
MKRIGTDRTLYVDCDDTLVMWNLSEYPDHGRIKVSCFGYDTLLVPNEKNIRLVQKFAKLGYTVIIWSQTGAEWAEAVADAVGLHPYATAFLAKPRYYLDDLPCQAWCGERLWRSPYDPEIETPPA